MITIRPMVSESRLGLQLQREAHTHCLDVRCGSRIGIYNVRSITSLIYFLTHV